MTSETQVVIVGAGPVGLVTALALARSGIEVVVLEALRELPREQRGAAFHPPTLEMLESFGITDDLLPQGLRIPVWQIRDKEEGVVAEFDLGMLAGETRYPYRFHLPQHHLAADVLAKLEREPRATVMFGASVEDVKQDGERVEVRYGDADGRFETIAARWVVGCDGARSAVRKSSGIDYEGFTWPERFLVTNVDEDLAGEGFAETSYVADPDKWAVILRLADPQVGNLWRIAMPSDPELPEEAVLAEDYAQDMLRDVLGRERDCKLVYQSTYRVHQRVASRFRNGRVLLAGDAAHINNPIGGFGLNGGVHDAINLSEKLAAVCAGADCALLDLYDRQRRHVAVENVQRQSIRNKRLMQERDPGVRRQNIDELRTVVRDPELAKSYLRDSSMISSVAQAAAIR